MDIILIFIFIVTFTITFYLLCRNHTTITNNKAHEILSSNKDGFFDRLNDINLYARNVTTIDEYKKIIKDSIIEPNLFERMCLSRIIYDINQLSFENTWVNTTDFYNIPWKFIIVKDNVYEHGLPHTRFDYIILPQKMLCKKIHETLLHEKLHVYQKKFPMKTEKYVLKYYRPIEANMDMARANPDTNNKIYKHIKNNTIHSCNFINSNPENILETVVSPHNHPKYEHPYEKMVYDLVNKYYF